MNTFFIIISCLITIIILKLGLDIKYKEMKKLNDRGTEEIRKIAKKFPDSKTMCEQLLKKMQIKDVKVKIDDQSNNCLYTVFNKTILIGKFKEEYMKLQTIAHECIHASQNKKILWANFIISNIYNIYFLVIIIMALFNKINHFSEIIFTLILLGTVQYVIRNYLENEAMQKAKFLAKEYIEKNNICTLEEKKRLIQEYEGVNEIGIPFINYITIQNNLIRIIICSIIFLI